MPAALPRDAPSISVLIAPPGSKADRIPSTKKILSFVYEDDEKKADKLTLTVDNFDLSNFDEPLFADGNVLEVSWGYAGRHSPPRELVIKNTKGGPVLNVEAMAKSVLMNQKVQSRVFANKKRSEVVAAIALEQGYGPDRQLIEDTEETFEFISQVKMTNAQFVRNLAQKESFEFFIDFDGFHFHRRKMGQRPLLRLTYYLEQGAGDIITFNVENDIFAKPQAPAGEVKAQGRDPLEKKPLEATASNANTKDRERLGEVIKVVDPQSGKTSKRENSASSETMSSTATTQKGVEREAKGAFIRTQQSAVQLKVHAVGNPDLVAKSVIEIVFPSKTLTGRYYVKSVKHSVGAPYTMEIDCKREGPLAGAAGVGTGKGKDVKNEGKPNTKEPAPSGELHAKKIVDPKTGATKTIYVDSKGRDVDFGPRVDR